jgi:polysaccharide biosynthesis/export protein
MSHFRRFELVSVVFLLVWLPTVLSAHAADEAYVIGAADVLEVQVWDNKDLNQVVSVRPDGRISLPLVGEVQAAGKTVQQLQDALAELYTKTVKGAIPTVLVKEIKSRPVYFIGGFATPGAEQLTRDLTVLQGVSLAGGLSPMADGDNGFVMRGGRRIPINFTRLLQKGDVSQNIPLEPGDSVVVPVADSVYVHGEVKTPGAIKATSDLTVMRAISQAGGFTPLAATNRVEILRGEGEKKDRIKIDLDKVRAGAAGSTSWWDTFRAPGQKAPEDNPDVRLMPNDIIFVPQRLF